MPISVCYPPLVDETACDSHKMAFERLGFLSHDLRSPLTSILALVDSLRYDESSKVMQRELDLIEQYTERGLHIGDQLMQLLRVENLPQLEHTQLDGFLLLENASEQKAGMAKVAGVALVLSAEEQPTPWVSGQADMLERALENLIDNAIKYSHPGGTVTLSLAMQDGEVHFAVRDRGIGMRESDLAELFCRYGRQRHAPPDKAGAGLGLHLVKTVAMRHGGRITAESVAGEGSCFTLSLPLSAAED